MLFRSPDYSSSSDINTLFFVCGTIPEFIRSIAPLGKRYGRKDIRAPLVMTEEYLSQSLDVFPMEFLDLKTVNTPVFGRDVLAGAEIDKKDLRLQCERELKGRLVNLRQGFIETAGEEKLIRQMLIAMLSSFIPVFRGLLFLKDKPLSRAKAEVLSSVGHSFDLDMSPFHTTLSVKKGEVKWAKGAAEKSFQALYDIVETLAGAADAMAKESE